jgi:hypothetical protein
MITGWCAIAALKGPLPKGTSVFSAVLLKVADAGTGQAVLSSLLLASGAVECRVCDAQCADDISQMTSLSFVCSADWHTAK